MAFSYTGGDAVVEAFLTQLPGEKWGFRIFSMVIILALGFFIDFVEISFIVVPILAPVAETLGISMLWFAILIAMNLQTSFLTPVGFQPVLSEGCGAGRSHTGYLSWCCAVHRDADRDCHLDTGVSRSLRPTLNIALKES